MPTAHGRSPAPMPCHTPRVYATVIDCQTGEVLRRLGPYASASAARTGCGQVAGTALRWSRGGGQWEAGQGRVLYRVPVDGE